MNRDLLAAAAPQWITLELTPVQTKFDVLAMWTEAIMDSVEFDHQEPDTWEALYLTYAIHALVEGRFYAALKFSEMVLIDPSLHRPPRLLPIDVEPVKLADRLSQTLGVAYQTRLLFERVLDKLPLAETENRQFWPMLATTCHPWQDGLVSITR